MTCEVRMMLDYEIRSAKFIEERLMSFSLFLMGWLILDLFKDSLSIFQVM